MSRIAWHFRDYTVDPTEEYKWEINPKEFDITNRKQLSFQTTAAPDGRVLAFEGRDEVQKVAFSGTVLTESQYEQMLHWFTKRHQVEIEDDLGRIFSIYITSFNPKRERNRSYPWKHSYTCEAIVLDWSS